MARARLLRVAIVSAVLAGSAAAVAQPARPTDARPGAPPTEVAARATLDRWLTAQNAGRYADYAALYAPGFAGVKRVGRTVKKMNRAAWLKDRKAMFRAPLSVSATEVRVVAAASATGGATIDFIQTWAQGAYADLGPKRIVLDATGALIVSEELLSSRPMLTATACLTALYPGASLKRKVTGPDDGARPIGDIEVRDLGGRSTCEVLVEGADGADVALGLFAFGKKWALTGRLDLDYDRHSDPDDGSSVDGEVTLAPRALHPTIPVVEVANETRRSGNEYSDSARTTTLYRVDGDGFEELRSWESGGTTGEADKVRTCELEPQARRSAGWPDLTLTCTTSEVQWAAGENEPTETTETTHYRWDGSSYAEK